MARVAASASDWTAALRLIAVTPEGLPTDELVARGAAAVAGGATALWLRDRSRHPRELLAIAAALQERALGEQRAWLIVSDRLDVALAAGADALQLGHRSLEPRHLRGIAPPPLRIGYSAHLPLDRERAAVAASDFVILGSVFDTVKPGPAPAAIGRVALAAAVPCIERPVVAVGGIDGENAASLSGLGLAGIAVIRAIFAAADPDRAAAQLRRAFG